MNSNALHEQKKGISPIIATLLLILIAIAAGVIVYAYVIGFIGNSTTNAGGSTNTLSIDQLTLNHAATAFPATVYLRNLGPTTESFNSGFYLKGSSINDQVGPAVSLVCAACTGGTATVNSVSAVEASSGSLTVSAAVASCTNGATMTATGFGVSAVTLTCASNAYAGTLTFTANTFSVSTSPALTANTAQDGSLLQVVTSTVIIFGLTVTQGTISIAINNVAPLTLAVPPSTPSVASNPLSAGTTYTVQVTGTDGGSTTSSAKSS